MWRKVNLLEIAVAKFGGVQRLDQPAVLHDADTRARFLGAKQVVRRHQDRHAARAQIGQQHAKNRSRPSDRDRTSARRAAAPSAPFAIVIAMPTFCRMPFRIGADAAPRLLRGQSGLREDRQQLVDRNPACAPASRLKKRRFSSPVRLR